jgi:hypothetical protein
VVDFGVERHPSHRGDYMNIPSIFSSSYIVCSSRGTLVQSEGASSEGIEVRLVPTREDPVISL